MQPLLQPSAHFPHRMIQDHRGFLLGRFSNAGRGRASAKRSAATRIREPSPLETFACCDSKVGFPNGAAILLQHPNSVSKNASRDYDNAPFDPRLLFREWAAFHRTTTLMSRCSEGLEKFGFQPAPPIFMQHEILDSVSMRAICPQDRFVYAPAPRRAAIDFTGCPAKKAVFARAATWTRHSDIKHTDKLLAGPRQPSGEPPPGPEHGTQDFVFPTEGIGDGLHFQLVMRRVAVAEPRGQRPDMPLLCVLLVIQERGQAFPPRRYPVFVHKR